MVPTGRQIDNDVHRRKIKQRVRGWKDEDQKAWWKWVQDHTTCGVPNDSKKKTNSYLYYISQLEYYGVYDGTLYM